MIFALQADIIGGSLPAWPNDTLIEKVNHIIKPKTTLSPNPTVNPPCLPVLKEKGIPISAIMKPIVGNDNFICISTVYFVASNASFLIFYI